jgi:sodium-dependent dicarboxylate transporter 2/3/5
MLGVAYAASIGGVATLIGTPTNAVFKGFVEANLGVQVGFIGWMKVGLPIMAIFLPLTWFYLTSISQPVRLKAIPGGREMIRAELRALGPVTRGEGVVLGVFLLTVAMWVIRPTLASIAKDHAIVWLQAINDASIAIFGSLLLFAIPVKPREHVFAMDWATAQRLPWGALILFGGGLSLAAAITSSGLDATIGHAFTGLHGLPVWLIVLLVAAIVCFASELASNTAVATAILPVLAAAAPSLGVDPVRLLVPATLASSLAFMLPVGTPSNAIVFATGHTTMRQMARAGFGLNIMAIVVITVVSEVLWGVVATR